MIKTLTIDRKTWGTGRDGGNLLNLGKKCCLGFYCNAVGFTDDEIRGHGMPSDLVDNSALRNEYDPKHLKSKSIFDKLLPFVTLSGNSRLAGQLASVNDSTGTLYKNPAKREARIAQLFAKIGVKVKFIN